MKVFAKPSRSLAALASASSFSRGTRSILFSTRIFSWRTLATLVRIASASSSIPALASSSTQTRSASWAPLHAVDTMARSSRRFGEKIPGVSTRMIWALFSITMPRIKARVVCTLRETMVTLEPTSALASVDLPAFGAPISATKPQRVASPAGCSAGSATSGLDAFARQHGGGGGLLGDALGAAGAFGRREARQLHSDAELRTVVGPGALDFVVSRRRQAARLCPFLQHGFRIALRRRRRLHAHLPQPLHQVFGGRIAAVEIDGADQRFADVGEDRRALAAARIGFRRAEPDRGAKLDGAGDLGAGFLAHQVGEPSRQLTFVGLGEAAKQQVGNHQAQHMVAEEFEPLVGTRTIAHALERGNVSERRFEERRVFELVADAFFERGAAAAAARLLRAVGKDGGRCGCGRGGCSLGRDRRV